jgi:hypothetical protein
VDIKQTGGSSIIVVVGQIGLTIKNCGTIYGAAVNYVVVKRSTQKLRKQLLLPDPFTP